MGKPLNIPTMAMMAAEGKEPEVLFWVGCAGSFDARAQRVTVAFCKILNEVGIEFAILGNEEMCTGDPARRAYVRRINISGNTRTRDEVVRREFRQFESSWYDGDKIKLSRDRVDRLGFFTDVNVETQDVAGTSDQVDVSVNVIEKPTGNLQLGAGFSSAEKVSLSFGVKQENVFGSGNYLGVEVNTSKLNR